MSLDETLVELINIPSVIGDEEEITTAIEFRLAAVRPVKRLGNGLVVGEPTGKPIIVLYGHTDTVPEQDNGTATVHGERIHGLGASDMKAGIAVMVHLLETPDVIEGPYDVVGVFYDKEEGPSAENGLEDVLDAVPWLADAEFSIVLEPTDLNLELGCNGAMNADIVFNGHAAHSARPWLGENAVTKAGDWLAEMHNRRPESTEIAGLEYREVFSVTKATGGIANNVLPSRFTLNLNYRFPPIYDLEEAEARLRDVASAADEILITDRAPAGTIPEENSHLDRLEELVGGAKTAKQGWTDVARLTGRGIPAVNYGPGEVAQAHQVTESVPTENLGIVFDVLHEFLTT
ncbi:MAG: succinyl-diaminopimelate desuccinylase [Acidimicrobiia bacterium]|nr:succinyl-diaminopimelate desuccinylase [Acidimicrobiia bacterium]